MQVRELTDELLDEMLEEMGVVRNATNNMVLTSDYVNQFNRGVAHRIQRCEDAHAISVDLAIKTQLR